MIVNVGGSKNRCVVGFNIKTGKTDWITYDSWGASYSSPALSKINDKHACLVFTGGESRPPTGGLIVIDPENGKAFSLPLEIIKIRICECRTSNSIAWE